MKIQFSHLSACCGSQWMLLLGCFIFNPVFGQLQFAPPVPQYFGLEEGLEYISAEIERYPVSYIFNDLDNDGADECLYLRHYSDTGALFALQMFYQEAAPGEPVSYSPAQFLGSAERFGYMSAKLALEDLDGDGDLDIYRTGRQFDGWGNPIQQYGIVIYENTSGQMNILDLENGRRIYDNTDLEEGFDLLFEDLDLDGRKDMLVLSRFGAPPQFEFLFFRNNGSSGDFPFDAPLVNPYGLDNVLPSVTTGFELVGAGTQLLDLDQDGDKDMVVKDVVMDTSMGMNGPGTHVFTFYENTGTSGTQFSDEGEPFFRFSVDTMIMDSSYLRLMWPSWTDADGDGDLDIILSVYETIPLLVDAQFDYHRTLFVENTSSSVLSVSQEGSIGMSVYPNPAASTSLVRFSNDYGDPATIEVFDISGRLVWKDRTLDDSYTLTGSITGTGTFTVRIRMGDAIGTVQLIFLGDR